MDALIGAVCTLAGTLLGSVLHQRATRRAAAEDAAAAHRQAVRDTVVALAVALTAHRRDLYTRWALAHRATPATPGETTAAREASHTSRTAVTGAWYQLLALTDEHELLHAARAALATTYAIKAKGEDPLAVGSDDLAARRQHALAADHALLATVAGIAPT
jgi:hypothetical protein